MAVGAQEFKVLWTTVRHIAINMINSQWYSSGYWMPLVPATLRASLSKSLTHVTTHIVGESIKMAFPSCLKSCFPSFDINLVCVLTLAMIVTELVYCSFDLFATGQAIAARFRKIGHVEPLFNLYRLLYSVTIIAQPRPK